ARMENWNRWRSHTAKAHILGTSIRELPIELSPPNLAKATRSLEQRGVGTIGAIVARGEPELADSGSVGSKAIEEIKRALERVGLRLEMYDEVDSLLKMVYATSPTEFLYAKTDDGRGVELDPRVVAMAFTDWMIDIPKGLRGFVTKIGNADITERMMLRLETLEIDNIYEVHVYKGAYGKTPGLVEGVEEALLRAGMNEQEMQILKNLLASLGCELGTRVLPYGLVQAEGTIIELIDRRPIEVIVRGKRQQRRVLDCFDGEGRLIDGIRLPRSMHWIVKQTAQGGVQENQIHPQFIHAAKARIAETMI
ncbi:hypothetical protein HZC07_05165, partial [Candidatus Micrarchaeota archaeon]|nr:hypothetical protein [Candidatus Micrarchaeota archaeon]